MAQKRIQIANLVCLGFIVVGCIFTWNLIYKIYKGPEYIIALDNRRSREIYFGSNQLPEVINDEMRAAHRETNYGYSIGAGICFLSGFAGLYLIHLAQLPQHPSRGRRFLQYLTRSVLNLETGDHLKSFQDLPKTEDEEKFAKKRSKRYVDVQDSLFEQIELATYKKLLSKKLRKKQILEIYNDPALSAEEKFEMVEWLEGIFKERESSIAIYAEDEDS